MNDAENMNQSSYRRAFRYLKSSVSQSSLSARFTSTVSKDADLEAVKASSSCALQIVFFPSYARKVSRPEKELLVNVHGWISSPVNAEKSSRRNRYTMLLARSLAGLPALPSALDHADVNESFDVDRPLTASTTASKASSNSTTEARSSTTDSDAPDMIEMLAKRAMTDTPSTLLRSNSMKRQESSDSQKFVRHYSDHDLVSCHANLTSRISPFLAKPVSDRVICCNILSDGKHITSAKMVTGENGHFRSTIRIPQEQLDITELNMLEAHVAEEGISGSTEIHYVTDSGVSVISDMDDTIKHTNILAGMREAFRNAFVRDLPTLQIDGVRPWYESMKAMGCNIHYVSNAPYQLWPCLAAFIRIAGLPSGSIHLKQYSGFLQGMFEPAAEKKRANVEKILMDFPERKFLLIGDSGEQDLELYTELARSEYTNQILGIFIRDVSTIASALSTPTGESGEEFFSKNQGDDIIDNAGVGNQSTGSGIAAVKAPQLPKRPIRDPLIDLAPLTTSTENVKSSKSNMNSWADMLSLDPGLSMANTTKSTPSTKLDEMPSAKQADADHAQSSTRPSLPRKPTNLRFWSKTSEAGPVSAVKQQDDASSQRPTVSRTNSSNSINGSLQSAQSARRPGILRTLSANSSTYYGEGRRMSKAQERTHAWEIRLARARATLPKRVKLYTWKEGSDCQAHAEELIRAAISK